MKIIRSISEANQFRDSINVVGLIPTMGAIHEGHLSLVRKAREDCDIVIVTIFTNPIQFSNRDDFSSYPNNIDQDLKRALIAESNLFLMPSRIEKKSVEGFGISFIEAASYGIASIGGKDGGASDAILHNKTGFICDGNDLNSIYDSVIEYFENDKFIKFGHSAKIFSENFHWDKVVKNYLKLIN